MQTYASEALGRPALGEALAGLGKLKNDIRLYTITYNDVRLRTITYDYV